MEAAAVVQIVTTLLPIIMRKISLQKLKQVFLQQLILIQVIVVEAMMKQATLVMKKKEHQRIFQVIQIMMNSLMAPLQMSLRQKNLVIMTQTIPMTETRRMTMETVRKMIPERMTPNKQNKT
jgi:hypothetical protein